MLESNIMPALPTAAIYPKVPGNPTLSISGSTMTLKSRADPLPVQNAQVRMHHTALVSLIRTTRSDDVNAPA